MLDASHQWLNAARGSAAPLSATKSASSHWRRRESKPRGRIWSLLEEPALHLNFPLKLGLCFRPGAFRRVQLIWSNFGPCGASFRRGRIGRRGPITAPPWGPRGSPARTRGLLACTAYRRRATLGQSAYNTKRKFGPMEHGPCPVAQHPSATPSRIHGALLTTRSVPMGTGESIRRVRRTGPSIPEPIARTVETETQHRRGGRAP